MPLSAAEFSAKYPVIIGWISRTLSAHASQARAVDSIGFVRLQRYFDRDTLQRAKVVVVDRLPVPPLSAMGLTRFADWERTEYGGITYLDTYFVTPAFANNESLHFHELIHVIQWRLLGPERFVRLYAAGLEEFGYRDSPLEAMAYRAQESFDQSIPFDAGRHVADALRRICA